MGATHGVGQLPRSCPSCSPQEPHLRGFQEALSIGGGALEMTRLLRNGDLMLGGLCENDRRSDGFFKNGYLLAGCYRGRFCTFYPNLFYQILSYVTTKSTT